MFAYVFSLFNKLRFRLRRCCREPGKRIETIQELDGMYSIDIERIKALSGSHTITARRLYDKPTHFKLSIMT